MLERIGRFITDAGIKRSTRIAVVVIIFVTIGSFAFVVEWILSAKQLPLLAHGTIDGAIVGGLASFTAWFIFEVAQRERTRLRMDLEKEARLNHEIRNALEVIGQAGYLIPDLNLKKVVSAGVQKIDSILKERTPRG